MRLIAALLDSLTSYLLLSLPSVSSAVSSYDNFKGLSLSLGLYAGLAEDDDDEAEDDPP